MTSAARRVAASDRSKLEKLQAAILEASQEIEAVRRAPRHVDDIREALLVAAKSAVHRYAPEATFEAFLPGGTALLPENFTFAHFVYLFGAEHLADLSIERLGANAVQGALRASERKQKLEALQARTDELERAEETEILRLEAEGLQIIRRPQARPELLLTVWESYTAKTEQEESQ